MPDPSGGDRDDPRPDSQQEGVRLLAIRTHDQSISIFLDDGRDFELSVARVPADLPDVGELVPEEVLQLVVSAAARKLAARDLLSIISRRLQPLARLRSKLLDKGHNPEAVASVLEEMQAKGLCSDLLFAEAYCRDRLLTRAVGRRYLLNKLREKRVSPGDAAAAVASVLSPDREQELAERAARQRWSRMRGDGGRQEEAKVHRFLMGRGFDAGLSARVARATRPEPEES